MTIGVLFVCRANICRSPMAEGVFRDMAHRAGFDNAFTVDSAGTSADIAGQPPSPPAIKAAAKRGCDISGLRARRIEAKDIGRFDYVLAMERSQLAELRWLAPRGVIDRPCLLTKFCPAIGVIDVADPFGGSERDYECTLDLIEAGCKGLLEALRPIDLKS